MDDVKRYLKHVTTDPYDYQPFAEPIQVTNAFFEGPTSHRYVDGRNAFYLVDNWGKVYGTLRSKDPQRYSRVSRASFEHLDSLISTSAAQVWVGFVGNRLEVNLVLSDRRHFRWRRSHWQFIDRTLLTGRLLARGVHPNAAQALTAVLFALSDAQLGTLILIADDAQKVPKVVGAIDDAPVGKHLRQSVIGASLLQVMLRDTGLGTLSSDGLTTISKTGRVTGIGQIIDNTPPSGTGTVFAGGGRTQAAMAASAYGIVLKVSQDGPISLFESGHELIRF